MEKQAAKKNKKSEYFFAKCNPVIIRFMRKVHYQALILSHTA